MPSVFEDYLLLINKFKSRGGKIIFIRHKAEANWNIHIQGFLPRAKVWDVFIGMVDSILKVPLLGLGYRFGFFDDRFFTLVNASTGPTQPVLL